jgi:prepilin-type N-terminal cleavage/methylation domain-containing protein
LRILSNSARQQGFSLVELIAGMVVLAILATGFLSAFSVVLKNSVSPLQTVAMESIAASQMDKLLSGTFQSAVAASGTTVSGINVDGTDYWVTVAGQSSVVGGSLVASSGVHLTVTVSTSQCASCVSLSGDTFDVQ